MIGLRRYRPDNDDIRRLVGGAQYFPLGKTLSRITEMTRVRHGLLR